MFRFLCFFFIGACVAIASAVTIDALRTTADQLSHEAALDAAVAAQK